MEGYPWKKVVGTGIAGLMAFLAVFAVYDMALGEDTVDCQIESAQRGEINRDC